MARSCRQKSTVTANTRVSVTPPFRRWDGLRRCELTSAGTNSRPGSWLESVRTDCSADILMINLPFYLQQQCTLPRPLDFGFTQVHGSWCPFLLAVVITPPESYSRPGSWGPQLVLCRLRFTSLPWIQVPIRLFA